MNEANDFTWEQRGAIDFIIGTPYSNCPAQTLFERDEWEKGWQEQFIRHQKRILRVAPAPVSLMSARLQEP